MRGMLRQITAEGLNLERLLQSAAAIGMDMQQLERCGPRRVMAAVEERRLPELLELAELGGWQVTPGRRIGMGRLLERLQGRWVAVAAVMAAVLLCFASSNMIWQIRITGAGEYTPDIRQALQEMGLQVPMPRAAVNTGDIRDALEWRYPKAAWFEVGWRGLALEVRMVSGVSKTENAGIDGPCDVLAERDGVVHHIITRAGTAAVRPGDVVQKGDVLIRGEERTAAGEVRQVAARGSVYARVWDSAAIKTPLLSVETEYTGRTHMTQVATSPWFPLWQAEGSGYSQEDVSVKETPLGGFFWPLTVRTETHYEADLQSVLVDYRSVLQENERAALHELYEIAGGRESLVDIWVNWSIIEDEILLSVATGERLVDIARQERSSGMAATE